MSRHHRLKCVCFRNSCSPSLKFFTLSSRSKRHRNHRASHRNQRLLLIGCKLKLAIKPSIESMWIRTLSSYILKKPSTYWLRCKRSAKKWMKRCWTSALAQEIRNSTEICRVANHHLPWSKLTRSRVPTTIQNLPLQAVHLARCELHAFVATSLIWSLKTCVSARTDLVESYVSGRKVFARSRLRRFNCTPMSRLFSHSRTSRSETMKCSNHRSSSPGPRAAQRGIPLLRRIRLTTWSST